MFGEPWVTFSSVTHSVLKDFRGLPQSSHDKTLKQVMPETFLYVPIQSFPNHPTIMGEMPRKAEKHL